MAVKVARSVISLMSSIIFRYRRIHDLRDGVPPAFYGKSIGELHLRAKYRIDVIAVKEVLSDQVRMMPSADYVIKDTDILVVMGKEIDIKKIEAKTT